MVKPFADDGVVLINNDAAHKWVGACRGGAHRRKGKASAHKRFMLRHGRENRVEAIIFNFNKYFSTLLYIVPNKRYIFAK